MKKATTKEFMRVLVVLCVMFSFSVPALADDGTAMAFHGSTVEAIYDSIRHSAPEYEWEESIVTFENEGMTLVCSLIVPYTPKKPPIVITLNGFGGVRDSDPVPGTDEGLLKRNARILAEQGFASLRIDFRGSGDSDGDYSMTTFTTQISDALAAVQYVSTHLKHLVNTKRIGMLGFSQGGLVGSVTASKDKRVDSLVLWSPVSHPPICYEGLLTKQGIKDGLALENGGSITLPVSVEGELFFDITLGKGFFEDLFNIDPIADIRKYKKPLMVIAGSNDVIIWPQPAMGQLYLKYHDGNEKLVLLDADHAFDFWVGPAPEKLDDAIYWGVAWFIKTLDK
jgi:pimeloyl-ACP methyl ester carboxylesterase